MPIPQKKAHEFPAETREGESASLTSSRRKERFRKPPEGFQTQTVPEEITFLDLPPDQAPLPTAVPWGSRRLIAWLSLIGVGVMLVVGTKVYTDFQALYTANPFIGLFFLLGALLLGGSVVIWGLHTGRRFQKLKANTRAKSLWLRVSDPEVMATLTDWLQTYFRERWVAGQISYAHYEKAKGLLRQPTFYQKQETITEAFAPLDTAARERIAAVALAAGVSTAVSQRGWVDMLLMFGKGFYLVSTIAEVYGTRPGTVATLGLLGQSIRNGIFSGLFDTAGDQVALLLTKAGGEIPLLGAAANMAAQGLVNSTLICRLGLACMQECRPLPLDRVTLRSMYTAMLKEKVTLQHLSIGLKRGERG